MQNSNVGRVIYGVYNFTLALGESTRAIDPVRAIGEGLVVALHSEERR